MELTITGDDFDEVDFAVPQGDDPDGVIIDQPVESDHFRRRNGVPPKGNQISNHIPGEFDKSRPRSPPPQNTVTTVMAAPQTPAAGGWSAKASNPPLNQRPLPPPFCHHSSNSTPPGDVPQFPQAIANQQHPAQAIMNNTSSINSSNASDHDPPVGFFTARAAETLQNAQGPPPKVSAFNPHLESPSIRKTAGVDHTKTKPVNRDLITTPAIICPQQRGSNVVNPQADKARKLGMPGAGSPLQNRGSYKPPQMKRAVDAVAPARSALGDVTNASVNAPTGDGSADVKRQRIGVEDVRSQSGVLNV